MSRQKKVGGGRSRFRYRCRSCRRNKKTNLFTARNNKDVVCPYCKGSDVVSMEAAYARWSSNRKHGRCTCEGVPHPHEIGRHKLCFSFDRSKLPDWTDEDFQDYQRSLFDNKRRTSDR